MPRLLLFISLAFVPLFAEWPQWRGANWDGMASGDAPLHWSDSEHVKWKTAIPGRGHSSPVVWGDKVFVGALDGRLIALNAKTGKVAWVNQTFPKTTRLSITGAPRVIRSSTSTPR